uniref:Uncharacterized protein n=1 Tax=Setaria italica TaxID=4555 RepID=K3Z1F8_SETIT
MSQVLMSQLRAPNPYPVPPQRHRDVSGQDTKRRLKWRGCVPVLKTS